MNLKITTLLATFGLAVCAALPSARAGVFDLPSFIEPGSWSVGLEPEISLSNSTGVGFNLKPRFGVSDLLNLEGTIGIGTGGRGFRLGLDADFEWFPDVESQPGVATSFFGNYYRLRDKGQLIFGAKPMIYKTFPGKDAEFTPFFAIPIGWTIYEDKAMGYIQASVGCIFKPAGVDHFRFTLEAGLDVRNAYSYVSGGATYYY